MNILVVPTIREDCIKEFLAAWKGVAGYDRIIVVEDNPTKTFQIEGCDHFSWQEINDDLGEDAWIISRRDAAIKCYGFLAAYRAGADYIFVLDDDCYPDLRHDFFKRHVEIIETTPRWATSMPNQRTRGLPYRNLGKLNVVLNVGLWMGVPDLDAPHALHSPDIQDFQPPAGSHVLPKNQYVPLCGMNMCMKREFCCLSYFPIMGEKVGYRRFDDIWFGVIAKKICDHLDLSIACGEPFIHHKKASNVFANLAKEAAGIGLNETFWEVIDGIVLESKTPISCMQEIGVCLTAMEHRYYQTLGKAITAWAGIFQSMT